jgi:hypothetical protein
MCTRVLGAAGVGALARLVALALALGLMACADDQACASDDDCAAGEHCVSFDDNPHDNVLYAKTCARACSLLAPDQCSSGCCARVDGFNVCSPERWCR